MMFPVYVLLVVLLVYASLIDLRSRKIPNRLCGFILVMGIAANSLLVSPTGFFTSLSGLLVGFLPFLILHYLTGLGAGDVKLMAAVGATVGFRPSLNIVYSSFLAAALLALGFVFVRFLVKTLQSRHGVNTGSTAKRSLAGYPFPMAPGIALATFYVMLPKLVPGFLELEARW